jgi:hypothetical protein
MTRRRGRLQLGYAMRELEEVIRRAEVDEDGKLQHQRFYVFGRLRQRRGDLAQSLPQRVPVVVAPRPGRNAS